MAEKIFDVKERTYRFGLDVIRFLRQLPDDYMARTIGQQLLRSATSIGANIIEAQACNRVNPLLEETRELANILAASILTLKGKRKLAAF